MGYTINVVDEDFVCDCPDVKNVWINGCLDQYGERQECLTLLFHNGRRASFWIHDHSNPIVAAIEYLDNGHRGEKPI